MANYNLREVLKQLGRNILSWVKSNCVNNCVSTTTNLPLAAAQGKALQDQITTLNSNIIPQLINDTAGVTGHMYEYAVGHIGYISFNDFTPYNISDIGAWASATLSTTLVNKPLVPAVKTLKYNGTNACDIEVRLTQDRSISLRNGSSAAISVSKINGYIIYLG